MDFDSPDVERDFPGLYASESGTSKKKDESDFSEGDHEKVSKKELLIGRRKDKKDKKDRGYAALEGESSPEEDTETKSPSKSTKKVKAFKFSSSKSKEKREKSREKDKIDKEVKEKDKEIVEVKDKDKKKEKDKKDKEKEKEMVEVKEKDKKKDKDKKEKDKKEKTKDKDKKDKKSKQASICEEVLELGDVQPVFGVSVSLATERSRCHDGVDLPLVVRDCIDYLQEHGLHSDQLYKVEPVKTRLQHFKRLYNNRESTGTDDMDIPTACGLLKLFLRELPEPVLTTDLCARFEEAASQTDVTQQEQDLRTLLEQLPSCNVTLLGWVLLHFDSVIQNEKTNKMNAQSLAMLLSPTLQMSHRLLVTLLLYGSSLFPSIKLIKYVPPITSMSPKLPETREEIQIELAKQESLLAQIHAEMNAGFASKKREEQLWEVQRIITQLKRKLRTFERKQDSTQKSMEDTIDGEACTDSHIPPKAKSSCSDDESIKTVTILSTESATNTETKSTPQDIYPDVPSTVCEENPSEISENISPSLDDTSATSTSKNPEKFYISESGLLMLPESHPERLTLIRLQLENQELTNWKCQLQARINAERADLLRLKKLTQATENEEPPPPTIPPPPPPSAGVGAGGADESDYERIIEHYVRENTLLEQKRDMLTKEIFEENQELIQMKVELALRQYKI